MLTMVALALVVGAGALLYLRSRGDERPSAAQVAAQQRDCGRLLTFRSLLNDPAVVPSSPKAGARPESVAVLVQSIGNGDELVAAAPSKVRGDVTALVAAVRQLSVDSGAMQTPAFFDARQHLAGFLDDSGNGCQASRESGDG